MEQKKKEWVSAGRFDTIKSTYMHRIFVGGINGTREFVGYSKAFIGVETPDKIVLLERLILRLIHNGYLFGLHKKYGNPTIKIEIYLNGNYTGVQNELLIVLYPDNYVYANNLDFNSNQMFYAFVNELYKQAKTGSLDTSKLIHKSPPAPSEAVTFDYTKKRFTTEQQLYDFMHLQLKAGHPMGIVMDFHLKYRQKWL
jgi:hypothetical protein